MPKLDSDFSLVPNICLQALPSLEDKRNSFFTNTGAYFDLVENNGENRFFPKDNWHSPTNNEWQSLLSTDFIALQDAVTVIDVDPSLRESFWENVLPQITSIPEPNSEHRAKLISDFAEKLVNSLAEQFSLKTFFIRSSDVYINPPNAISTAFNFENHSHIGLHIDDHEKLALDKRRDGFQLLAINFGQSERYFHFINLSVLQIIKLLDLNPKEIKELFPAIRMLKDLFLKQFPTYPVVRVVLKPNQAYIAVTQNIIHDGATNDKGHPDIAFLIGGKFALPNT